LMPVRPRFRYRMRVSRRERDVCGRFVDVHCH
jgi:hypothetical protein